MQGLLHVSGSMGRWVPEQEQGAGALVSIAGALKLVTALSLRTAGSQLQPCADTGIGQAQWLGAHYPATCVCEWESAAHSAQLRTAQAGRRICNRCSKAGQTDAQDMLHA